jgi:hypothetical protein
MDTLYVSLLSFISTPFKLSFIFVIIPSILVIVYAVLSAKELGGELGNGLKKVAAGTICYVILYFTTVAKEILPFETTTPEQLRLFYVIVNAFASTLLGVGFYQIYNISKRLRLF